MKSDLYTGLCDFPPHPSVLQLHMSNSVRPPKTPQSAERHRKAPRRFQLSIYHLIHRRQAKQAGIKTGRDGECYFSNTSADSCNLASWSARGRGGAGGFQTKIHPSNCTWSVEKRRTVHAWASALSDYKSARAPSESCILIPVIKRQETAASMCQPSIPVGGTQSSLRRRVPSCVLTSQQTGLILVFDADLETSPIRNDFMLVSQIIWTICLILYDWEVHTVLI